MVYMRYILSVIIILAAFFSKAISQGEWGVPLQITNTPANDLHPAIANAQYWLYDREEYLAFSRDGKNICVLSTLQNGLQWDTIPQYLTTDSAGNDYPSLTWTRLGDYSDWGLMMVWQSRRAGNFDIFFSRLVDQQWTSPARVDSGQADDGTPHIASRDSGFAVVWECEGKIIFAEYTNGSWSPPEFVTSPDDTLNLNPQVRYIGYYPNWYPVVIWQRRKQDKSYAIMYALKNGESWTQPDTIIQTGDHRYPRFFKVPISESGLSVAWSMNSSVIASRNASYFDNTLTWEAIDSFPATPLKNQNQYY